MKSKLFIAVAFLCLFARSGLGVLNTEIHYETTDLDGGRKEGWA